MIYGASQRWSEQIDKGYYLERKKIEIIIILKVLKEVHNIDLSEIPLFCTTRKPVNGSSCLPFTQSEDARMLDEVEQCIENMMHQGLECLGWDVNIFFDYGTFSDNISCLDEVELDKKGLESEMGVSGVVYYNSLKHLAELSIRHGFSVEKVVIITNRCIKDYDNNWSIHKDKMYLHIYQLIEYLWNEIQIPLNRYFLRIDPMDYNNFNPFSSGYVFGFYDNDISSYSPLDYYLPTLLHASMLKTLLDYTTQRWKY